MGFESANLPVVAPGQSGGLVASTNAIPSWQGYFGSVQINSITHNAVSLGAVNISILGPNYGGPIIEGNYTVSLQAGFNADPNLRDASIAQSGFVPVSTRSLLLKIGLGAANFNVALGSNNLQLNILDTGANYTLYGADISAFGGQFAELKVTSFWTALRPLNPVSLDSIVFSSQSIPEPNSFGLFGLGALVFLYRRN